MLDAVALIASLDVFSQTSTSVLRRKSALMTGYLDYLMDSRIEYRLFEPMCPNPADRGAQLSLRFHNKDLLDRVVARLRAKGIVVAQHQDVMRVAPVPLYNTFLEIWDFVDELQQALSSCESNVQL